jgi:hypothetical protein
MEAQESVHVGSVVTTWHWDRFFSQFFGFLTSISFHRDSILIYHLEDEK